MFEAINFRAWHRVPVLDASPHGIDAETEENAEAAGVEPSPSDATSAAEAHNHGVRNKDVIRFGTRSTEKTNYEDVAMIDYQTKLLGRTEVAEGTMAFQFEKPSDFVFKAGQYIDLTLSGSRPQFGPSNGLTHTFSIASSPSDEELVVTTRMRNTLFKQAIFTLPIGSPARIEGPMGSFSLHNNTARPAVFLAGGIGIAPFLSMLCYATEEKLRHSIVLFYANRHLQDAAFIDTLWKLERDNPRFRFVPTLTRAANNNGWKGKTGHIGLQMLFANVGILRGPIYYIAGPPTMVAAVRKTIAEVGVDEDDIRTEEFAGY
jgi:ferredoxin-NADP reductase